MPIDTDELDYIVRKVLGKYPEDQPWPINIIDIVFNEIEKNYPYRHQYDQLIGKDGQHKDIVNQMIGKLVKQHTGLETLNESVKSQLNGRNMTYTELGPKTNGND